MPAFETTRKILFEHCDPAGIVFYPRYFEMLNNVVEEWFEDFLGVSFAQLHGERHSGIPTVSLQADFKKPSRLGDVVTFRYGIEKLGGSSLTARFEIHGPDGLRLSGQQVLVHVDIKAMKPTPFPDDLRAGLERTRIDVSN
jgi:4-hydroxybenzoyl-CoA thioesterase